jgi:hypothetical protein
MTKVKFYIENRQPLAVFPEIEENPHGQFKRYTTIGQHSVAHTSYFKNLEVAEYREYWQLLQELVILGYNDLEVLNYEDQTRECHRAPTKGEIRFGEGATHYRIFTYSEIGHNNKTGKLKQWFVADDGLRYYTR